MTPEPVATRPCFAYYRATQRANLMGERMAAQRAAVRAVVAGADELRGEFLEVQHPGKQHRPHLLAAIEAARQAEGVLLIAKLGVLAHNAGFLRTLRDAGVAWVCCDRPDVSPLTVEPLVERAQDKHEAFCQRIKDTLATKQARGERVGSPDDFTPHARRLGLVKRQHNARQYFVNDPAVLVAVQRHRQGYNPGQIARELNETGHQTRREKKFCKTMVQRMLVRAAAG